MIVYPVTNAQYRGVAKRKSVDSDYRIVAADGVATLLPQFSAPGKSKLLGVRVDGGKFVEKRSFYGSLGKVTQLLTKHEEDDLVVRDCTAFFDQVKLPINRFEDLLTPISVTPRAFLIRYTVTRVVPDKLMDQLEDNLRLLKETRGRVASERARDRRKRARARELGAESKSKAIQDAINLLKENEMCVIRASSLDCK